MHHPTECPICERKFQWGCDDDSKIVEAQGERWLSCRENAYWKLSFHMASEHADVGFRCNRRFEAYDRNPNRLDFWHKRDGIRVCSYCGSAHPDEVFAAIEAGNQLTPTDKSYKLYFETNNPQAGQTIQIGSSSGPAFDRDGNPMLDDLTIEEKLRGSYNRPIMGVASKTNTRKFYFQHFSQDQMRRFVDLHNARKLNLATPGYFYRLPFFMVVAK